MLFPAGNVDTKPIHTLREWYVSKKTAGALLSLENGVQIQTLD